MSTRRRSSLVPFVCVPGMFFTAGSYISPTLSTGPQSTLTTLHHGYQNLKVHSEHRHPRRGWATISRHIHSEATASGESCSQVWRSAFKNADLGDKAAILVSTDGNADYVSIQHAVHEQVPKATTRMTAIFYIDSTSGANEEKVITLRTKSYIALQELTRHGSAGTLMSASVVVDSELFTARDIPFKNSAGPPVLGNKMNFQAAAFQISGGMAFLCRCNCFDNQNALDDHEGRRSRRHCNFRSIIEGFEDFDFGVSRSISAYCGHHRCSGRGANSTNQVHCAR